MLFRSRIWVDHKWEGEYNNMLTVYAYLGKNEVPCGTFKAQKIADVKNVYLVILFEVDEQYRRRGIATRIFEEVLNVCRECGIVELVVDPDPVDPKISQEELIVFYTKLGFKYQGMGGYGNRKRYTFQV